uniref:ORF16 n=1 Tax=Cydia pomonella granulosis virus TaxID=28289 RepID=A0A097P0Z2_GVCP|nr:ORF16 [Cydia pomonella granulovirus]
MTTTKKYLALDGVACTTKSTILSHMAKQDGYTVHLIDYKEITDLLKLGEDPIVDGMVYMMYRCNYTVQKPRAQSAYLFDREPASAIIYRLIFSKHDDATIQNYCNIMKRLKQTHIQQWQSIILLPCFGQEQLVVEMMTARNNGIDWLDVEYVNRQRRVFLIWAHVMDYMVVYIDYTKNLDEQQQKVCSMIESAFSSE